MPTHSDEGVSEPETAHPLVIGHRGASRAFAENTLEAFAGAADLGADWVEFDVRRLADDTLVIHHDAVLADGRVLVELGAAELPRAIPTFSEAMATCGEHGLGINIEIKSDPNEPDFDPDRAVARRVAEQIAAGPGVLVTSFDPECLAAVRDVNPAIETGLLTVHLDDPARDLARIRERGHVAVNPRRHLVDEAFLRLARAEGLRVYPWTIDNPAHLRFLVDLGVDGVITNVPDVLRAVVDEVKGERG